MDETSWLSIEEAKLTAEWLEGMGALYIKYGPKIPKKILKEFVDNLNEKYKHEN